MLPPGSPLPRIVFQGMIIHAFALESCIFPVHYEKAKLPEKNTERNPKGSGTCRSLLRCLPVLRHPLFPDFLPGNRPAEKAHDIPQLLVQPVAVDDQVRLFQVQAALFVHQVLPDPDGYDLTQEHIMAAQRDDLPDPAAEADGCTVHGGGGFQVFRQGFLPTSFYCGGRVLRLLSILLLSFRSPFDYSGRSA